MRHQRWLIAALTAGAVLFLGLSQKAAKAPLSSAPASPVGKGDPTHPRDFLKDLKSAPDPRAKPDPRVGPDPSAGPDPNAPPDGRAP